MKTRSLVYFGTALILSVLAVYCLPHLIAWRIGMESRRGIESFIETHSPNLIGLTDNPSQAKSIPYPVSTGFEFGRGATSDQLDADIYLKDNGLIVPGGYTVITASDHDINPKMVEWKTGPIAAYQHEKQYLMRSRSGRAYRVEFAMDSSNSEGILLWLVFAPLEEQ